MQTSDLPNQRKILGLFGQAGSGKSTVARILHEKYGYFVINQDILGYQVLEEFSEIIIQEFGKDMVDDYGIVDRKKLGNKVFNDKTALLKLNAFSYPHIINKTLALLDTTTQNSVIEGAFFFRVKNSIPHTSLIKVCIDHTKLVTRLLMRGHTPEWIHSVLDNQMEIINEPADYTLFNNSTIRDLEMQVERMIDKI
ncbi:Dephospho-CoA kinase [Brevinema andersonii]|uniref:Dephospho-CoA kinase n=1 Tax=Brevinema andersonii TaxID=34097 RepID=A0A1I1DJI6_BREAD|nr:dephospho-CoA kinase [Brevinema andersonii]SFB75129.1 Dephospho-CoA kinase [Brevinema andersonii]